MNPFQSQNIDQIAAFLAVHEGGSFIAAAKSLSRHSTIISKRISDLEARLGVRLIERTTRQLRFTEAGLAYIQRLQSIRDALEEAELEVSDCSTQLNGTLRLAVPGAFGRMWLAKLIAKFGQQHPTLNIHVEYSERFVDIIHDRFDAAIRIGDLPDSRLRAKKLADNFRILCASPSYIELNGYPEEPIDLQSHHCFGFTELASFPTLNLNNGSSRQSIAVNSKFLSNDGEALLTAAIEGAGILAASEWLMRSSIKAGKLIQVLPEWRLDTQSGIYFVRPSIEFPPAKIRLFKSWIESAFESGVPWE
ncbi:LysR family transcriptional regulator [Pseudomonas sp. GL-B-26]|uniref:LysR family transcriptional regulator n=1 Tax=Pseudomonas sp. GL-B-26 TaxID=2832394 RepID=UPI001CBCE3FE|nr:LysR family transcriptional regulator [Pseudomonas sp. GL-B-26]